MVARLFDISVERMLPVDASLVFMQRKIASVTFDQKISPEASAYKGRRQYPGRSPRPDSGAGGVRSEATDLTLLVLGNSMAMGRLGRIDGECMGDEVVFLAEKATSSTARGQQPSISNCSLVILSELQAWCKES